VEHGTDPVVDRILNPAAVGHHADTILGDDLVAGTSAADTCPKQLLRDSPTHDPPTRTPVWGRIYRC
jgi:hypothetical protein